MWASITLRLQEGVVLHVSVHHLVGCGSSALCSTLQAGMWLSVLNRYLSSTQDRGIHNILIDVLCNILLPFNLLPLQTLSSC